jgi:hypothetical protein
MPLAARLGVVTRALLSQIEETSADRHADVGWWALHARYGLPPSWDLRRFENVARGYQERFPDDAWLDELASDRLLFPDVVREMIRPQGIDGFLRPSLPPEWRLPSPRLGLPLCVAGAREPALVRGVDFRDDQIAAAVAALGLPPDEDESRIAARHRLLAEEAAVVTNEALHGLTGAAGDAHWLDEFRALYPWNPVLCRLTGILAGLRGDLDGATSRFLDAVQLEPDGVEHWLALARTAELRTLPDAAVFAAVAHTLAHVRGG